MQGRFTTVSIGFAPGFLLGTQIAGLLFFLNPDLPFTPGPWSRAVLLYGTLLGIAGLALQWPFTRKRPSLARRLFPWCLTGVLALSAVLHGMHASVLAFYLPPGINERLLKAALWLTLAALIFFYTALLHTLHRRRYGRRSQIGLALVTLGAVYATVERREAFQPRVEPAPLVAAVEAAQRPNLLFVGIDSATLDAILPLAEQGRLPFFARMIQEGSYGHLEGLEPAKRLPLWTTASTGKLPYKHGILGGEAWVEPLVAERRLRQLPLGIRFRYWGLPGGATVPVNALDRLALPLWEFLPGLGVPTGVIGLPLTDPTPGAATYCFSERFFAAAGAVGLASPPELAERGRLFRIGPDELDPGLVGTFDGRLGPRALAALAADRWRESLAQFLLEQRRETRAVFLLLPGLETASRRWFGAFSAVEFEGSQNPDAQVSRRRLVAYYAYLDTVLAELWGRLREPRLLAVVSVSGARRPEGLQRAWGQLVGRPPIEGVTGRDTDGLLMLRGSGVKRGSLLAGGRLTDVVPTVAYGLGLPIARDLDGQVLTAAFDSQHLATHPMVFLPSYDALSEPVAPTTAAGPFGSDSTELSLPPEEIVDESAPPDGRR